MSKRIFSAAILIGFTALSTSFVPVSNFKTNYAKDEKAVVFIYRVGQFNGAAANWSVYADGTKVCKISNNKFMKLELAPGKHEFNAKIGGPVLFKKETGVELEMEAGQTYYIACNIKQSFTRPRLELIEVTKGTANKQMATMTADTCQEKIDVDEDK
jgi:hypothetical protein